jgi:hypothetical protein
MTSGNLKDQPASHINNQRTAMNRTGIPAPKPFRRISGAEGSQLIGNTRLRTNGVALVPGEPFFIQMKIRTADEDIIDTLYRNDYSTTLDITRAKQFNTMRGAIATVERIKRLRRGDVLLVEARTASDITVKSPNTIAIN